MKASITVKLDEEQIKYIKEKVLDTAKGAFEYDIKSILYEVCKEIQDIYRELIRERSMELEKSGLNANEYSVKRYCQGEDYAYIDSINILARALSKLQNDNEIINRIFGKDTFYEQLKKAFSEGEE